MYIVSQCIIKNNEGFLNLRKSTACKRISMLATAEAREDLQWEARLYGHRDDLSRHALNKVKAIRFLRPKEEKSWKFKLP